jgi:tripartite-type tricarboxylate transporter receptor subunit TctC
VPFTSGGGVDTVARIVGEELKGVLGQSVVVENLPGTSGMRGRKPPFVRSRTVTPFCILLWVKPQ